MIRLGSIDADTSHVVEFARRFHRIGIPEDQHVPGARIVAAWPGTSTLAPERIGGFVRELTDMGVPLVDRAEDLLDRVDGVLILSLDGAAHLERARPFLEAGLPCFIDKPFACCRDDALKIRDLAAKYRAPVFSASALRFAPEVVAFAREERPRGVVSYGPALNSPGAGNPGLFHYAIHPAEQLFTLMGPGCRSVVTVREPDADAVTALWQDGRIGTLRGLRHGTNRGYGFVTFGVADTRMVAVDTTYVYRELLKQIVTFVQTGRSPVSLDHTIELMAFLDAANRSAAGSGTVEPVGW